GRYVIATGGAVGSAKLWDIASGKALHTFIDEKQDGPVMQLAFSRDSKYVAIGGTRQAILWDVISGNKVHVFPSKVEVGPTKIQLVFLPDGKRLLTMGQDGAALWDIASGDMLFFFAGASILDQNQPADVSPDGKYLAILGADYQGVVVWDIEQRTILHQFKG